MQSTPTLDPGATGPARVTLKPGRLVTDAPTRMFHWLFALSFVGAYLTGIVCVFAYMGALLIAAPVAFGEPLVEERSDLVVFVVVSLFFGLIMGHSWFRGTEGI